MYEPLLNNLLKYLEKGYINEDLKYDFTFIFWKSYGLHQMPEEYELLDNYVIRINDTHPYTGKTTQYKIPHVFTDYVRQYILKDFENLIDDFYNEIRFKNKEEKANYITHINNELDNFLEELNRNAKIKSFINEFKNGIKTFKNRFQVYSFKRLIRDKKLPNSFTFSKLERESYKISRLYKKLILEDIISSTTSKSNFMLFFNDENKGNRIIWNGTVSEFYYFIKMIQSHKDFKDLGTYKWEVASKCFYVIDRKGVEFDWKKFRGQKPPSDNKCLKLEKLFYSIF